MKKKRVLTGAAVALVVLLVAPLLVPGSVFIPRIQQAASVALKDDVDIGSARLALLPLPHVTLTEIRVGKRPYLQIAKLSVTPNVTTLLSARKTIRTLELSGVTVRQPLFARLERLKSTSASSGEGDVELQRIVVRNAELQLKDATLAGYDAEIELRPGNMVRSVLLQNGARSLRVSATPQGRNYAVVLDASNWRLPAGPPLTLASLRAEGELTPSGLNLPSVRGRFYGGEVSGKFALQWSPEWLITGRFDVKAVELQPIAAVYSKETAISGRLFASGAIDMKGETPAALAAAPNAGIDFEVQDGILHRMDLAAAVSLLPGKEEAKTGQTRFDRFSGHLTVDAGGFHFTDLKISSGVLNAEGFVSVSPQRELSGRIDTAMKGTGSLVGTPLAVSGTVDAPKVRPTKGTLAGAAAGTLLLGPGVGTTIGMKAAEFTERLFGKKPPKPKRPATVESAPASEQAPATPPAPPRAR